MSVDNFDFIEESYKTNNVDYRGIVSRLNENGRIYHLMAALADFSTICEKLDVFKKGIFYGKPEQLEKLDAVIAEDGFPVFDTTVSENFQLGLANADAVLIDLLHAVVGNATEGGELVDCFANAFAANAPVDLVNAGEEVGDSGWYQSLILKHLKKTFAEIHLANYKKLQDKKNGRYKTGTFTADEATTRDLTSERQNLEASLS